MNIHELRVQVQSEEVDYAFLTTALRDYVAPRAKISTWLRRRELIRVKKGLYVFGRTVARQPYCVETLANLIYGPSYISLEYALQFYGLLTERVTAITSVTNKRNKAFHTPVGDFTYRYIHPAQYAVGMTQTLLDDRHPILIATPEKALVDQLVAAPAGPTLDSEQALRTYLFDDLRLDRAQVKELSATRLREIATIYAHPTVTMLVSLVRKKRSL